MYVCIHTYMHISHAHTHVHAHMWIMVHRFVVELNEDINSIIMNAVEKDDMGRDPRISSMLYILYADKGCS